MLDNNLIFKIFPNFHNFIVFIVSKFHSFSDFSSKCGIKLNVKAMVKAKYFLKNVLKIKIFFGVIACYTVIYNSAKESTPIASARLDFIAKFD